MAEDVLIELPDTLKDKAPYVRVGGVDERMLAQAEAVISNMSGQYLDWVAEDFKRLDAALDVMDSDRSVESIQGLFFVAHDMKGQGGSFGYPLITKIGNSLCRYLELQSAVTDETIQIARVHAEAMKLAISASMKDENSPQARRLLEKLEHLVQRKA